MTRTLARLALLVVFSNVIAFSTASGGEGFLKDCDDNGCDSHSWGSFDGWHLGQCLSSQDQPCEIVPGMFGDGGLVIPRTFSNVGGTRAVFQNHIYKVAENNSALPQNRIGFNFNALGDVYSGLSGDQVEKDIYEYRLFAEKTLLNGLISLDFMLPFYTTSKYSYPSNLDLVVNGPGTESTFGDIAFGLKALLHRSEHAAYSAGLRIEAPTAEEITAPPGPALFYESIRDDVWNFTPYFATLWQPSDRVFTQSFVSYRMNTGTLKEVPSTRTFREPSYFMADVSIGYWLYRNAHSNYLTGLAPTFELHYTGAWDKEQPDGTVNNVIYGHTDRLNMTAGLTAMLGRRVSAGLAISAPLRDKPATVGSTDSPSTDRAYDWAAIANLTYHFGG
ncbi:hypothetical protein NHH03_27110 [Stieleria sp. TO1_6]|uniref:hypothetical protein n=1 Tax=Stieleria tagensis TaxID=2956795 RepID=UPI00209B1D48|nr:hypothetical protein [Stieleria tagensis]MCO8125438.1 hypothetical protein [Stieleria tagensis]